MSIENNGNGGIVFTGEGVEYFRLSSIKQQLKLEKIGLKSSGGALRPRLAKEFGLKPRDSYEKFIEAVEAKMGKIIKAKEQGNG